MNKRIKIISILVSLSLIGSVIAFVHIQRHTQFGIVSLGGANYWIEMAQYAPDSVQAQHYLERVTSCTPHGTNEAEAAIRKLDYPGDVHRLFLLLAEVAPNDSLRSRYIRLAELYKNEYPMGDFDIYK